MSWKPLPPRRNRKERHDNHTEQEENLTNDLDKKQKLDNQNSSSNNSGDNMHDYKNSKFDTNRELVENNVLARTKIVRATHSLETKDGVAGEFYEYLDHTAYVQLHACKYLLVK